MTAYRIELRSDFGGPTYYWSERFGTWVLWQSRATVYSEDERQRCPDRPKVGGRWVNIGGNYEQH